MSISAMDIFTIIPAVGAALIAIRNWIALRKGAIFKYLLDRYS